MSSLSSALHECIRDVVSFLDFPSFLQLSATSIELWNLSNDKQIWLHYADQRGILHFWRHAAHCPTQDWLPPNRWGDPSTNAAAFCKGRLKGLSEQTAKHGSYDSDEYSDAISLRVMFAALGREQEQWKLQHAECRPLQAVPRIKDGNRLLHARVLPPNNAGAHYRRRLRESEAVIYRRLEERGVATDRSASSPHPQIPHLPILAELGGAVFVLDANACDSGKLTFQVPSRFGPYPVSLMKGGFARCNTLREPQVFRPTTGTSGKALVSCLAWASVHGEECSLLVVAFQPSRILGTGGVSVVGIYHYTGGARIQPKAFFAVPHEKEGRVQAVAAAFYDTRAEESCSSCASEIAFSIGGDNPRYLRGVVIAGTSSQLWASYQGRGPGAGKIECLIWEHCLERLAKEFLGDQEVSPELERQYRERLDDEFDFHELTAVCLSGGVMAVDFAEGDYHSLHELQLLPRGLLLASLATPMLFKFWEFWDSHMQQKCLRGAIMAHRARWWPVVTYFGNTLVSWDASSGCLAFADTIRSYVRVIQCDAVPNKLTAEYTHYAEDDGLRLLVRQGDGALTLARHSAVCKMTRPARAIHAVGRRFAVICGSAIRLLTAVVKATTQHSTVATAAGTVLLLDQEAVSKLALLQKSGFYVEREEEEETNYTILETSFVLTLQGGVTLSSKNAPIYWTAFDGGKRLATVDTEEQLSIWELKCQRKLLKIDLFARSKIHMAEVENDEDAAAELLLGDSDSEEETDSADSEEETDSADSEEETDSADSEEETEQEQINEPNISITRKTCQMLTSSPAAFPALTESLPTPSTPQPNQRRWAMIAAATTVEQQRQQQRRKPPASTCLLTGGRTEEQQLAWALQESSKLSDIRDTEENLRADSIELLSNALKTAANLSGRTVENEYVAQLKALAAHSSSPIAHLARPALRISPIAPEKLRGCVTFQAGRGSNPQSNDAEALVLLPQYLSILYFRERIFQMWRFD